MTMTSWPYVAQDTTDIEYGRLFREMAASDGMAGSHGDGTLQVSANGSGREVRLAAGSAILRGYMFYNTATEIIPVAAPSAGVRVDLVVLELNLSSPTVATRILPKVLSGTSGSTNPPGVTRTVTGIYQIPLATVRVDPGVSLITADKVSDAREWMDQKYGVWTTARRPVGPRKYKLGFNETTGGWEYHNGSSWVALMSVDLGSSNVSGTLPLTRGGTGATTAAAARTALGLGTVATDNTVPVSRGGTGSTSAAAARSALDITPTSIGAAPSSHNHSASDITTGTLSVARGGTGETTLPALLNALGIFVQSAQPAYAANRVWIKVP